MPVFAPSGAGGFAPSLFVEVDRFEMELVSPGCYLLLRGLPRFLVLPAAPSEVLSFSLPCSSRRGACAKHGIEPHGELEGSFVGAERFGVVDETSPVGYLVDLPLHQKWSNMIRLLYCHGWVIGGGNLSFLDHGVLESKKNAGL